MRAWCHFLCIALVSHFSAKSKDSVLFVWSQETPTFNVQRWSVENVFKTDLCDRQRQLTNNEITLDRALAGLNISVALTLYDSPAERQYFDLKEDDAGVPRIKRHNPGFYVRVLDELAERAGFQWRQSFASVAPVDPTADPSDEGKTWTDLLTWELDVYDVSVDFWMKDVSRMKIGVYFPDGFVDSSLILIEPPVNVKSSSASVFSRIARNASIWAFLEPFESSVWWLIVIAVFSTGVLYWTLEHLERDVFLTSRESSEDDHVLTELSDVTFNTAVTFSQHFQFMPHSDATRLLSFSWAFWALIVGSAYLANLASVLVEQHQAHYAVLTMESIAEEQLPLYVLAGALPDSYLSNKYPTVNFVRKLKEEQMFEGLQDGECAAAALSLNVWQRYERDAQFNPGCKLKMNRNILRINPGCFATSVDSEGICSSLLGFVLDYHFTSMKADGTLDELWAEHLDHVGTQQCEAMSAFDESDDLQTLQLSVSDLGGIFVLHAIFSIAALVVALVGYAVRRKQGTQKHLILGVESHDTDGLSRLDESSSMQSNLENSVSGSSSNSRSCKQNLVAIDVEGLRKDDLQRILSTARKIGTEDVPTVTNSESQSGGVRNFGNYTGRTTMAANFARRRRASIFNAI